MFVRHGISMFPVRGDWLYQTQKSTFTNQYNSKEITNTNLELLRKLVIHINK